MTVKNNTSVIPSYYNEYSTSATTKTCNKSINNSNYGKTVGTPELSEKAKEYYDELKKKYSQYDFILVSADQKTNAQANASKYANNIKTVVLIDEEKIERMASDEKYRKQYESILNNAQYSLSKLKNGVEKSGANVQGYGIKVNDGGTLSFFAVLKRSSAEQKARIERKRAENKEEKRATEKKTAEKRAEEKIAEKKAAAKKMEEDSTAKNTEKNDGKTVTIMANSIEELIDKIGEYSQNEILDSVLTDAEKTLGQHIDFKG